MRVRGISVLVGLMLLFGGVAWGQQQADPDPVVPEATVPAAVQHAFEQGRDLEKRQQLTGAVDSYQAAVKAASGRCDGCMEAILRTQMKMEDFKAAAGTAAMMARNAPDAKAKAQAEKREGLAFYEQYFAQSEGRGGVDKNPKKAADSLKQAEAVLAQSVADDASDEPIRMLHARVMAAQKRDEDASKEFAACAATPGTSEQECARALRFAKDVGIARNEPAPAFKLKAMDGSDVTLDKLAGKIVLVDFWATWCPVCRRDSDYIQTTVDAFDPQKFVLLEVDAHEEESRWKQYVADQRLEGLQTRDNGEVADAFHVGGYPTYVVLDGDGIVRMRAVGIEGDLKGEVKKLLQEQKAADDDKRVPLPKSGAE